jgi:pyruvate dehydrogenase E1 component alpha subunit
MKAKKSGTLAEESAPAETFVLIPDAVLQELHRRLLAVAGKERGRGGVRKGAGIERYAAAKVAVWFDLNDGDTVLNGGGAMLRDVLGAALLDKARKNRKIALVWGGEHGAKRRDALKAARAQSLPVVFVCEEGEATQKRTGRALKPGEELPCITVDGHDVVAAYRVAHEAIERARRDRGPTLILLATYRVAGRAFTDAVADMERYLKGRGLRD